MSEFRDAIAAAIEAGDGSYVGVFRPDADSVLAMPEMEAIRRLIRFHYWLDDGTATPQDAAVALREFPVPDSVIDWVLGGES